MDFKILHLGVAQYASREAQEQRAPVVAIRARADHTDYQRMGRERDQRHHRVQAAAVVAGHTAPGPVLSLLRSYGLVRGLVFGAYAEASPDVHALLSHTASLEARRSWEEMGARGYHRGPGACVCGDVRRLGHGCSPGGGAHAARASPGAATAPPDHACMLVTGWRVRGGALAVSAGCGAAPRGKKVCFQRG